MKKVYLAGPDVFFSNATELANDLKRMCENVGLEGVFPLDAVIQFEADDEPVQKGFKIFKANVGLIKSADAVLANMTPFRGPSMDVGTAWEMGCGYALGKPVVGYTNDMRRYKERVTPDEHMIEDFNMLDNLMLESSAHCVFPSALEAVQYLGELLKMPG